MKKKIIQGYIVFFFGAVGANFSHLPDATFCYYNK